MDFNQLLEVEGVDPTKTVVMRHKPVENQLNSVLPHIAKEQRHLFHTYQSIQGSDRTSSSIQKAQYVVAMLAFGGDSAVFVGIYEMIGHCMRSKKELQEWEDVKALIEKGWKLKRPVYNWHNLDLTDYLSPLRFSLSVRWPPGQAWVRWANNNVLEVLPFPVVEVFHKDLPS